MGKIKPANAEELKIIKLHFKNRGYGIIADETALAQTDLLKLIRSGEYDRAIEEEDSRRNNK